MKQFLHNVAERIRSRRQGRTKTHHEIVLGQDAVQVKWLTMENDAGSVSFSWEEVLAVDTFKRDYFTVDCICLAFQISEGWVEVIESRLSGFPPKENWWRKVIIPAFEMNHVRLWIASEKDATPSLSAS